MKTHRINSLSQSPDTPLVTPASSTSECSHSESINVDVFGAESLCGDIEEQWNRIRNSNSVFFDSPYFDIEFTKAVARVRDDVRIGIVKRRDKIVGFLPFQENKPGHAVPVGGMLNDWHGIMGMQSPEVIKLILKAAKLHSFKFHAIYNVDDSLKKYYFREFKSHFLDLSEGWEPYKSWVFENSSAVKRQGQKTRALGRQIGEVRFEFESQDSNLLERLIELKMVGAHFGMLTQGTLHYWFPVYAPAFHKYSPGTEMLMQSAKHACEMGIKKLDLGYGDDPYKFRFCNGSEPVAFGIANFGTMSRTVARYQYKFRNMLKEIPMKPLAKRILRKLYPHFGGWNFR